MARTQEQNERIRTDQLIELLSRQAGHTESRPRKTMPFGRALGMGLVLALIAALLVVLGLSVARADLATMLTRWVFHFKIVAMTLLVLGAIRLVRAAGTPGAAIRPVRALLPGVLFLLAGVIFDQSGYPLLGQRQVSVPLCVGVIVAAALPGLAFILAGLRRGIPTKLTTAGAIAGLLSGALAALVYTIACVNDGPIFVAVWYVVAISITAVAGAVAGRYVLAW